LIVYFSSRIHPISYKRIDLRLPKKHTLFVNILAYR
jgi:hypothetical protein